MSAMDLKLAMNMHQPLETSFRRLGDAWSPANGRRKRRMIVIAVVVLAAGILLWRLAGSGAEAPKPDAGEVNVPSVSVIVPGATQVADSVSVTGSIAARRDLPIGVQGEGGAVTSVLVDAGDYVRAGQVLATIDKSVQSQQVQQLQASLVQSRADAALAQAELDRAMTLVDRGFISKADIDRRTATRDSANARVNVAAAQLREGQARLGRLDIRAPKAGLVLERNIERGQVVGAGTQAVFRMAEDGAMEMRAAVAEQDLVGLKVGHAATVQLVGSSKRYAGRVWMVDPVIDPQTRQGQARIAVSGDEGLRPGAFASGTIEVGTASRPVLPESAVLGDADSSYVYIVGKDGTVTRRNVKIGMISANGVAITSGLSGNEQVVLSAGAFLNPGEKIRPVIQKTGR